MYRDKIISELWEITHADDFNPTDVEEFMIKVLDEIEESVIEIRDKLLIESVDDLKDITEAYGLAEKLCISLY